MANAVLLDKVEPYGPLDVYGYPKVVANTKEDLEVASRTGKLEGNFNTLGGLVSLEEDSTELRETFIIGSIDSIGASEYDLNLKVTVSLMARRLTVSENQVSSTTTTTNTGTSGTTTRTESMLDISSSQMMEKASSIHFAISPETTVTVRCIYFHPRDNLNRILTTPAPLPPLRYDPLLDPTFTVLNILRANMSQLRFDNNMPKSQADSLIKTLAKYMTNMSSARELTRSDNLIVDFLRRNRSVVNRLNVLRAINSPDLLTPERNARGDEVIANTQVGTNWEAFFSSIENVDIDEDDELPSNRGTRGRDQIENDLEAENANLLTREQLGQLMRSPDRFKTALEIQQEQAHDKANTLDAPHLLGQTVSYLLEKHQTIESQQFTVSWIGEKSTKETHEFKCQMSDHVSNLYFTHLALQVIVHSPDHLNIEYNGTIRPRANQERVLV